MRAFPSKRAVLAEVTASLVGLTNDGITVLEASAQFENWDGEDRIAVEVWISDPPRGAATWPLRPLFEIRMEIRRRIGATGLEEFVDVATHGRRRHGAEAEPVPPPGPGQGRAGDTADQPGQE